MANVARSVSTIPGGGTIRLRRVKIYFQVFPGISGTDQQRGIPDVDFVLEFGKTKLTGKTAPDGSLEFDFPSGTEAKLTIFDTTFTIKRRGWIEALNVPRGLKRRLAALGYEPGRIDVKAREVSDLALLNFQADNDLNADCVSSAATMAKLKSVFGE